MIKHFLFAAALATFMAVPTAKATTMITDLWYQTPEDGLAFAPDAPQETGGIGSSSVWANFRASQTGDGSMSWGMTANNADDPTLRLNNFIDNDSGFAWTEYIVTVTMNKIFTFVPGQAINLTPGDWTMNVSGPVGPDGFGNYVGVIDMLAGTPIANGDSLEYTYKVSFTGSTSYVITESVQVVPEPATATLMGIGSLFFGGLAWARRRRS